MRLAMATGTSMSIVANLGISQHLNYPNQHRHRCLYWGIGIGTSIIIGISICIGIGVLVLVSISVLVYWCIGVVVYCCIGALVHWRIGALAHWRIGVLVHWCIGALVQWRIGALVYWCIGVLLYWRIGALVHRCSVQGGLPRAGGPAAEPQRQRRCPPDTPLRASRTSAGAGQHVCRGRGKTAGVEYTQSDVRQVMNAGSASVCEHSLCVQGRCRVCAGYVGCMQDVCRACTWCAQHLRQMCNTAGIFGMQRIIYVYCAGRMEGHARYYRAIHLYKVILHGWWVYSLDLHTQILQAVTIIHRSIIHRSCTPSQHAICVDPACCHSMPICVDLVGRHRLNISM